MAQPLPAELALAVGIAQLLNDGGAGTWRGVTGTYGDDVAWPITLGRLLTDRRGLAVRAPVSEAPVDGSSTRYGFQVMIRCAPTVAASAAITQLVRDTLHARRQPPMPAGIRCTSIQLQSRVDLGRTGGWNEHSLTFTALCARASAWAGGAAY